MDVGVTDEILNGVDYEESSSSEDEAQGTLVIKVNTYLKLNCFATNLQCFVLIL